MIGPLAGAAGLAAAHLVAAGTDPASSPVLAVGSTVIDLTPTPVKEWAIANFGTNDKPILIGSVMVGVALFAVLVGWLATRRFVIGAVGLLVLCAIAAVCTVTRPAADGVDVIPSLVAAVVSVAALWWLVRLPRVDASGSGAARTSRRVVLGTAAVGAGAVAVGGLGQWVYRRRTAAEDIALPSPADPAPAFPSGLDRMVDGISPFRTPNDNFYRVDTRLDTPVIDSADWSLEVDGDVETPFTITFDEVLAMNLVERDITMTCVSNSVGGEYVGAARWLGVPLKDLLDRAGVGNEADQILSTDFSGMTISTPLALATDGRDAMLAIGMNGEPLPRVHGFPARLVIPGLYGFISATKWVTRLTLTTYADQEAYWTKRGWDTDAPIKISSRIDTPRALSQLTAGTVVVGGVAWAQQNGGVDRVEVRIDGGAWQKAELGPSAGNDYWRQWFFKWTAEPGQHMVACRVMDGMGNTQTDARANPFPGGSSGIQSITVTVA